MRLNNPINTKALAGAASLSALLFLSSAAFAEDKAMEPAAAAEKNWPAPVNDQQIFTFLMADQLEYRSNRHGGNTLRWDAQGWIGGDYNKLWVKTEGERLAARNSGDAEVQVLYSRLVAPFWNFQAGVRNDTRYGGIANPSRTLAVIGFQGLAPYEFDIEPALFVGKGGDISARLTGTYDVLLTQRLIAQPRFETSASSRDVKQFDIGSGVNYVELGMRLRYEIKREFAPYVGVSWVRKVGNTADIARSTGSPVDNLSVVAGLRLWF
jgi:copper resistance protein B